MASSIIPGPPALPIVGNIRDVESELPIRSLMHLADTYGAFRPIEALNLYKETNETQVRSFDSGWAAKM